MRTEDFINTLAADHAMEASPARTLALALAAGTVVGAVVFTVVLGLRPDIGAALQTIRFLWKFVVTIALAVAGVNLVATLARPGGDWRAAVRLLAVPAVLIGVAVLLELVVVPADDWVSLTMGVSATLCLTTIPLIAIAPLMAVLIALRHAAPTRPAYAGAAAGLVASAIGATLYASHCIDDSPLFVLAWYSLATALVVAAGAFIGPRILRW